MALLYYKCKRTAKSNLAGCVFASGGYTPRTTVPCPACGMGSPWCPFLLPQRPQRRPFRLCFASKECSVMQLPRDVSPVAMGQTLPAIGPVMSRTQNSGIMDIATRAIHIHAGPPERKNTPSHTPQPGPGPDRFLGRPQFGTSRSELCVYCKQTSRRDRHARYRRGHQNPALVGAPDAVLAQVDFHLKRQPLSPPCGTMTMEQQERRTGGERI